MDFNKLTLGDKIIGGTGIVLLIDLLFLPWHSVDVGFTSFTRTAIQSPNGFWGILAMLLTVAVVLLALLPQLTSVEIPEMPIPHADAVFYGACAVLGLLLLKLLLETDSLGFGAFLGLLLAAGLAFGGFSNWQEHKKTGGAGGSSQPGSTPPQPF